MFFLFLSLLFLVSFLSSFYLFYLDQMFLTSGYISCLKCLYLPIGIPFFEWVLHMPPVYAQSSSNLGLSFVEGDNIISFILRFMQQSSLVWESYYIKK
jgi:hypothetical protein